MDERLKNKLQMMISEYQKVDRKELSDGQKYFYDYTEQAFNAVMNLDEWIHKSSSEKQCYRIFQIAKLRSRDEDITNNLLEVELYEKLREVTPYVMSSSYVINNQERHLTQDLVEFCENQLNVIDEKKGVMDPPNKSEVDKAFECYFKHIQTDRIPSLKVYKQPEVKEKIGELYRLYEKITTTYNKNYI